MTFIWPIMLFFLILAPVAAILYIIFQRRRLAAINASKVSFMQGAGRRGPGLRRHVPPAFFLASLTILLIAMARPQMVITLPKEQGTVLLAFDVSGSMAADDL